MQGKGAATALGRRRRHLAAFRHEHTNGRIVDMRERDPLNGAERVYAVDVDVKQLDWKVRNNPRVRPVELNARFLEPSHIGELVDLVTIDASFISLTMLLPRIPAVLKPEGDCLALVKPQFEVGREHVGKGGIVRDPALQQGAIEKVAEAGRSAGLQFIGSHESPIAGREGNREFFVLFKKS